MATTAKTSRSGRSPTARGAAELSSTAKARAAAKKDAWLVPVLFELGRASQMTHDLGGSLGSVGLFMELAIRDPGTENEHIHAALRMIRTSAEQLAQLAHLLRDARVALGGRGEADGHGQVNEAKVAGRPAARRR